MIRLPTALRAKLPGGRRTRAAASAFDTAASTVERLAALLAAGVPAPTAWQRLGTDAAAPAPVRVAAVAAGAGDSIADAITASPGSDGAQAWRSLASAWAVAADAGAPLVGTLRELGEALRDEAQTHRELEAAMAGPRASARLVTMLPAIALGFGMLLGFDTPQVLLGSPVGAACLVLGAGLLWAGARWNRTMLRRADPGRPAAGLRCDLLAIAMSGGVSLERGRRLADAAIERHAPDASGRDDVDAVVALAAEAGAPVVALLRAEAARRRREARADGAVRAAQLSVRLMIPLGVCVLPAFVLLGVAPLLISVVVGTLGEGL